MGLPARPDSLADADSSGNDGMLLLARKQRRDADEAATKDSPYASLAGFSPRIAKKKPVLTVDADELAEAYKAFELGASSLVEADEPIAHRQVDFLGLSSMDEGADGETLEDMSADVLDDIDADGASGFLTVDPLGKEREAAELRGHARLEDAGFDLAAPDPTAPRDGERSYEEADLEHADWQVPNTFVPEPAEVPAPRSMDHLLRGNSPAPGQDADGEGQGDSVIPSIQEQLKRMRALPKALDIEEARPPVAPQEEPIASASDEWDDAPNQAEGDAGEMASDQDPAPRRSSLAAWEVPPEEPVVRATSGPEAAVPVETGFPGAEDLLADQGLPVSTLKTDEQAPLDLARPGFVQLSGMDHAMPNGVDENEGEDEEWSGPADWSEIEADIPNVDNALPSPPDGDGGGRPRQPSLPSSRQAKQNSLRAQLVREHAEKAEKRRSPGSLLARLWRWMTGGI